MRRAVRLWFIPLLVGAQALVSPRTTVPKKTRQHSDNNAPRCSTPQRRAVSASSSSSSSSSSVEVTDPATGCPVVLLGCFHGSQSSAQDVQQALLWHNNDSNNSNTTNTVVVLELCAGRFAGLRRDQQQHETCRSNQQQQLLQNNNNSHAWTDFWQTIAQTSQQWGLSTAAAAALLGGVSGLQTALSGLQPGLEFTTALRIASAQNHDIVLADQAVEETVRRLGQLPAVAWQMWKEWVWGQKNWEETFGREAAALRLALWGNGKRDSRSGRHHAAAQVTLPVFLTRNQAAVMDLLRLLLPPALLLEALNLWLGSSSGGGGGGGVADAVVTADPSWLWVLLANAAFIGLNFLSVALPATRIILSERDEQLTAGIRAACQLASSSNAATTSKGRVVAVLGFLHVNGVAQRLSSSTAVSVEESSR